MNARPQNCNHCDHPLAPESPFCERCGKPVSQEQAAPRSPQPPSPPPLQGRSSELQPVAPAGSQLPKKSPILLIALITGGFLLACLLVAGVGVLLWQRGQNGEATGSAHVSPELEEFVARVVASEGAIVAHVITTSVPVAQMSPIKVWRCEHGELVREDAAALFRALSKDSSEWPPRTRYFAFKSLTSDRATVDLHTWYDIGMFDEGRGGFAEELEIARRWRGWVVVTRDWYMHWD